MELLKEKEYKGKKIKIFSGDLTEAKVDAIVNAANCHLQHGGGVAGAIVRKGGKIIQEESDKIGFVATGEAVYTSAGKLPAKYVIHTPGPIYGNHNGKEPELLFNSFYNSLKLAHELKLSSIAFPAISAGIYGYPKEECAEIFYKAVKKFLDDFSETSLKEIWNVNISPDVANIFAEKLDKSL